MKKSIVLIITLLVWISPAWSEVKAFVDREDIRANETFMLTVESDEFTNESPDLSVLPKQITVLGSSKYHRSSTVNGISTTQLGWKIQCQIIEPGVFTIPAITLDGNSTKPIQVTVKPSSDTFSSDENFESIMLKAELSASEVFVQEQLIYTVKLFRAVQTQYASLTEPNVENAIIEKLGEDASYETQINGTRYWVLERKYAIFPQQSGALEISPVTFSADVVQSGSGQFGRILGRTRPVSVSTTKQQVTIKPYPANHSGSWLPSAQLIINSRWSDAKDFIVGQPSTWTITIEGLGVHENQLPEIKLPQTNGVKWYPDTAQKSRQVSQGGIIGQRIERIAVVPTASGEVQLPKLEIPWFNTQSQQYETAVLEAQTIKVKPDPEAQVYSKPEQTSATPLVANTSSEVISPSVIREQSLFWPITSLILAVLWILTLIFYRRNHQVISVEHKSTVKKSSSKQILMDSLSKSGTKEANQKIYNALYQWMNEVSVFRSYREHLSRITHSDLKNLLKSLETSLYSQSHQQNWNGAAQLKQALKRIEMDLNAEDKVSVEPLKPLYPR